MITPCSIARWFRRQQLQAMADIVERTHQAFAALPPTPDDQAHAEATMDRLNAERGHTS